MGCYENLTKHQKQVFRADINRLHEHLEKWGYQILELSIMIIPAGDDQDRENRHQNTTPKQKHKPRPEKGERKTEKSENRQNSKNTLKEYIKRKRRPDPNR